MPGFSGQNISFKKLVDLAIIGAAAAIALYLWQGGGPSSGESSGQGWPQLARFIVWRDDLGALRAGLLLSALGITLRIAFWGTLLAAGLGLIFGFMRCSGLLFMRLAAGTYVGLVRNIPPLVLLFVVYFFVGELIKPFIPWDGMRAAIIAVPGLGVLLPHEAARLESFCIAVFALGLYEGAYIAEIVRAGLESVPKQQWEAARSLGLPRRVIIFHVILPQAFRLMLPPLTSQSVTLIKNSSIVSCISVIELTQQGRELINTNFMVMEIWLTITLAYLCISLAISGLGHLVERRVKWRAI